MEQLDQKVRDILRGTTAGRRLLEEEEREAVAEREEHATRLGVARARLEVVGAEHAKAIEAAKRKLDDANAAAAEAAMDVTRAEQARAGAVHPLEREIAECEAAVARTVPPSLKKLGEAIAETSQALTDSYKNRRIVKTGRGPSRKVMNDIVDRTATREALQAIEAEAAALALDGRWEFPKEIAALTTRLDAINAKLWRNGFVVGPGAA